jgi:spore coat protein A
LITRRNFIEQAGAFASSLLLTETATAHTPPRAPGQPMVDPNTLPPYVDPLPLLARANPTGTRPHPEHPSQQIPHYRVAMQQMSIKVHRDLPPTRLWGFNGASPGPLFETRSGEPLLVEWANELPLKHLLPIDYTLHGSGHDVPDVRSIIHLHGGRTPPESDGYPENWVPSGKSATSFYPNHQAATLLFYHDHSMGTNRLNVYAGLQGLFLIRDAEEDALNLPSGPYELPLLLCDRYLRKDGQLEYPISQIPGKPWVPEVFGNLVMVNGKIMPYREVEPRPYRLRILNGSNGRFYRLSFSADPNANQPSSPAPANDLSSPHGHPANNSSFRPEAAHLPPERRNPLLYPDSSPIHLPFHMIGSDQGLLASPVPLERVELSPGERADLIVDFSPCAGQNVELTSDLLRVMQFRVSAKTAKTSPPAAKLPATLRPIDRIPESAAVLTRRLTLDEHLNLADQSMDMMLNNTPWHMPITEKPVLDTTEIWELLNLTEDTHPIHLHLVRFQILDRRRIDTGAFLTDRTLRFIGNQEPVGPTEAGWKDTVRVPSGTLTRIIVPFRGYPGRYVWHCHILEHEDNEMMRPYEIIATRTPTP